MSTLARRVLALTALVALVAVPGCGKKDDFDDEVHAAIRRTQQLSAKFSYTDERASRTITVQGLVEDNFRYKARVAFDGRDTLDEVVEDDTLAVRFIDPAGGSAFLDKQRQADVKTEMQDVSAPAALAARRWVLDETAAPSPASSLREGDSIGANPVRDALTALDYVSRAVDEAAAVELFDVDDIEPAYSRSEDSFPKPDERSGVKRYDLRRPPLPVAAANTSGTANLPETRHFRKMAIYVKDGRVIQVRERVEATGKFSNRVLRYTRAALREAKANKAAMDELDEFASSTKDQAALGRGLLVGLNRQLESFGADSILVRNMTLDLSGLGDPVDVSLPATDVIRGSLAILSFSRAAELATTTNGAAGAEATTTTTTAAPAAAAPTSTP